MYLFNTALQYSYVALAMLPSASGTVARSKQTKHDHRSSRFTNKRDVILTQGGWGGGGAEPPHRGRARYIEKNVEDN